MHTQITPRNTHDDSSSIVQYQTMTRHVMSSREIAELTGKAHKHVLADIRTMLAELEIHSAEFSAQYKDGTGRSLPCFNLDRDLTDTLLTGYSAKMRMAVVRRWRELESSVITQPQVPSTFADALRLAAEQVEKNQALQAVIEAQAPKIEALHRLAETSGEMCVTDTAKHLGIGPLKLFTWLSNNGWIYRRRAFGKWVAEQSKLSAGLLDQKLVEIQNKETREVKTVPQVMVTRRGLVVLAEKIGAAL